MAGENSNMLTMAKVKALENNYSLATWKGIWTTDPGGQVPSSRETVERTPATMAVHHDNFL